MLPRIVNASGQEVARLNPSSLALDLNFSPLSTAVMTLPEGEPETPVGTLIEIPTPRGSAGVFRVQQAEHTYQGDMRLHLEHGLVTLSDGLIPGTTEEPQQSTARAILGQILSYQSMWELGAVEVPDSLVLSWSYDYSNLLESLLSVLDELPGYYASCDQSTVPWTLNVLAVDETIRNECRLTRNIESLTVETDRSELCTRLHVIGLPSPLDADTIGQYGVIERSMTGDEGLSAEELTKAGQKYLEEHKHPALTVSINAVDLSEATGDSMDSFLLGALCRVCLPDYGQTINQRIVTLSWPDMVADESYVRLTLANKTQTTSDALAGLIIDTTIQRKMLVNQANEIDRLVVRTIANEEAIDIITPQLNILALEVNTQAQRITDIAGNVDVQGNQISGVIQDIDGLNQKYILAVGDITRIDGEVNSITGSALWLERDNIAGVVGKMSVGDDGKIYIQEGSGLMVYEDGAAYGLYSENNLTAGILVDKINGGTATILGNRVDIEANDSFIAQANAITLKADQASLDLANDRISAQAEEITLKADKIDLQGYATIDQLATTNASISNLTSGLTTAMVLRATLLTGDQVNATYGEFTALTHAGALVSQRKITMGEVSSVGSALSTGGELNLQHSHKVSVADDGTVTFGEVSSSGGSFKVADTKAYKDGVSAAFNSVTLAASGWDGNAQNTIRASNGQELKVTIPNVSMGESYWLGGKKTVNAYYGNSGPLGTLEVEIPDISISWSNPQQNYAMVTVTVGGKTRTDSRNISGYT